MKITNSSIYILSVKHQRIFPVKHRFKYKIYMFYLDLDELPKIDQLSKLIGFNKHKLYSFFDCDHFESNTENTRIKLTNFIKQNGVSKNPKKIMLLTNLRIFNYIFNPVSFYFCFDKAQSPIGMVAEVGNTFGEKKAYFIPPTLNEHGAIVFRSRQKKEFYISPFSPLDLDFEFDISLPNKELEIFINDYQEEKCIFKSSLCGQEVYLNDSQLMWLTITNPFLTLKIISLIHWQALLLFLKKTPFFSKEAHPEQQTNVINPQHSLLNIQSIPSKVKGN